MKILHRYVLREHVGPFLFATTAVTSIMLLNYIAHEIGQLVGKGLPGMVIAEFVGLSVPFTVAMTLPMAVLVAVLYACSRLAAENEITAMKASGVGLSTVLTPIICAGIVLSLLMVLFNDQVLPRANHRLRTLQSDIARKKPTFALRPRIINEVSPGKFYLVAGRLDQTTNQMREVVIYDLGDPLKRRTIYADSGYMELTGKGNLQLTLFSGSINEIKKSTPSVLQRVFYVTDRVIVPGVGNELTRSTNDNYKSEREMSICELQRVVANNQRAFDASRHEVTNTLVGAVRAAALGEDVPTNAPQPASPAFYGSKWGLGRIYCEGVQPIFGVPFANAQAAPPPVPQHVTPRPGQNPPTASPPHISGAAPGTPPFPRRPGFGPSTPAMIALNGLTSTIEGDRARFEEDQRTEWTYDVEVQKKFAIAIACAVFVLLGAPIALRFPRGGVGLVIGVSFGVFALYYVGLIAGEPLAQNGKLSPFVAMWCSNFFFAAVGIIMLARTGRASGSTRSAEWGETLTAAWQRVRHLVRRQPPAAEST